MLKEVHVILWDQITAQIFPVHRVLCVSMAALPMNLNARIKTRNQDRESEVRGQKEREKQTRIFKTSEPFFVQSWFINGFHIEYP